MSWLPHEEEEEVTLEVEDVEVEGVLDAHTIKGWVKPKKLLLLV